MLRLTNKKKFLIWFLMCSLLSTALFGCNNDNAAAPGNEGEQVNDENALENAEAQVNDENAAQTPAPAENAAAEDTADTGDNAQAAEPQAELTPASNPTPIAERSPTEITRIEVDEPEITQTVTGEGDIPDEEEEDEKEEHEPTPNLFPMDSCQVEINGVYQIDLEKSLLDQINQRRVEYNIAPLTFNTSLRACADARCKEQTYFIGHFRPDGTAFTSIAPDYVMGECIAVDYRSAAEVMEAWFSVNKSRMQIMHPDYTQCGIAAYKIGGVNFIAAEFGY